MTSVRLLSYNVRSLRDDAEAVVRVIRSIDPDVVLVQEAPRFFGWRGKCEQLAHASGLVFVAGSPATGANVLMTSREIDVVHTRSVGFSPYRNLHHRGAVIALLRKAHSSFAVAGTHLDLIEVPRLRHLEELRAEASALAHGAPTVVGGDMNAVPGSATWHRLERFGVDAWSVAGEGDGYTYPSQGSVRRIDGVFVPRHVPVLSARVVDGPDVHRGSDHRPLVVEFEV